MESEVQRTNTILSTETTFLPTSASASPNPLFRSEYQRQFTWKKPIFQPREAWAGASYTPENVATRDEAVKVADGRTDRLESNARSNGVAENRNREREDASLRQAMNEAAGSFERERERERGRQTRREGHADVGEPTVSFEDKVSEIAPDKEFIHESMERGVDKDDSKKGSKTEEAEMEGTGYERGAKRQRKTMMEDNRENVRKEDAKVEEQRPPAILSYGHANRWPKVKALDMKTFNSKVMPKKSGDLSRRDVEKYRRLTQTHTPSSDLHPSSPDISTKYTQTASSQYATEYRQNYVNWFRDPKAVCWSNWTCGPDAIPTRPIQKSTSRPLPHAKLQFCEKGYNLPPPAGIPIDGIERLGRLDGRSKTRVIHDFSGESEFGSLHYEKRHYPLRLDSLTIQQRENERDAAEESVKLSRLQDRLRALRESTPEPRPNPSVLFKSQEIANPSHIQSDPAYPPPVPERIQKNSYALRTPFGSTPEENLDHASSSVPPTNKNSNPSENNMSGPTLTNNPTTSDGQRVLMYNCEPPTTYNLAQELLRRARRRHRDCPDESKT